MNKEVEILVEGSYLYFDKNVNYSQENFKLVHHVDQQQYHLHAEILSRVETGEFLKILVRYDMSHQFVPLAVRIEKSLGNKYALETYKVDVSSQELHYVFQNTQGGQEFKRPHSAKHYLTSPAFATSALFTLSKKFDATGRTGINLVNAKNVWAYEGPPTDKLIFAEFKSRELADFKLKNTSLSASHLCLYEHDASHAGSEQPVDLFLSKHYALPYQMIHGDIRVEVEHLKKIN